MAEVLAKKKRIRAGHKASATKTMGKVDDILGMDSPDVSTLSLLKLTLQEKLETIRVLDSEIVELIDDEAAVTTEIEQTDGYRESIRSTLLKIETALGKVATPPTAATATPSVPATTPTTSRVKLPKLKLRPFGGELTQWTSFWESFEAAVHNNPDLTSVEKFNYLASVLERSAREAISGLSLTASNYEEAISTLKKRFGGRQKIIDKHMDALLKVGAVTSCHEVKALRRLYDLVSSHIRSLKSLGVKSDSYGTLLCPVLLSRLPSEMQLNVSRKVSEADWNLDELMRVIEEEIIARERVSVARPMRRGDDKPPPTATALVSDTVSKSVTCCYCGQSHFPTSCSIIIDIEARKQSLRKSGRCFSCLRKGHLSRNCRTTNRCRNCGGRHHTSICTPRQRDNERPTTTQPHSVSAIETTSSLNPSAPEFNPSTPKSSLYIDASQAVLLQTALAEVYNPSNPSLTRRVRIVLDNGSQRSYLTQRIREKLALRTMSTQQLSIAAFGSRRAQAKPCDVVRVKIKTRSQRELELDLFVVPHICDPLTAQPASTCFREHSHLSHLNLADDSVDGAPREIDMLIGSDSYWSIVTGEILRGSGGPIAVNTRLGWVLSGPVELAGLMTVNIVSAHTLRIDSTEEDIDATLKAFWELESLGIKNEIDPVQDQFTKSIQVKGGRYQVSLPWREHHEPLPMNRELSLKRLYGLLRRLKQDPEVLSEYDAIIRDQLEKGIVERVQSMEGEPDKIHYLPHHAVIRRDKDTTKVRVVYDASSRSIGPSLNSCLHTGPKFNQKILEILLRFRSYQIALVADIEKAFLMISVDPKDRDVLRFLWVKDANADEPEIITLRFARVVFGVSSSPFLLNATIHHHLMQYIETEPDLVAKLMQSTYVDDVVSGADDEEQAYEFYRGSKELLLAGSFNLRKFVTNSHSLQAKIDKGEAESPSSCVVNQSHPRTEPFDETYVDTTMPITTATHSGEQRVLGVRWNVGSDRLIFDFREIAKVARDLSPTKRNVISVIGRFYDPLGFLTPITICFKVFMQELCKLKVSWDQQLAGAPLLKWKDLVEQLSLCQPMVLPRRYLRNSVNESTQYRLYGFCDASAMAYAAVVYLTEETPDGKHSEFVVSKTRVSPLKVQTIPRLELLSAVLLARLTANVADSLRCRLSLQEPRCFTDSQVALFWITGIEREWKPWVQNRVDEIRNLVPVSCWGHCAGKDNPADIPSRGLTAAELSVSKLWRSGPDALETILSPVPVLLPENIPESCIAEMKAADRKAAHNLLSISEPANVSGIIDCERYSSLHKLYRVTAYVLKFINILRKRTTSPNLTVQDICRSERYWVQDCQKRLEKDRRFSTWQTQFGLFRDENELWRCGGRLQNADLPFATKHPLLLDRSHYITLLVVRQAHARVQHNGVKETLAEVRMKFWIIGGRSLVKQIIHKCVVCRRFEGLPYHAPPAPPLPSFRVNEAPPFTYTAVDYAGPMYVRNHHKDVNGSKVWICLFTCCVTRATHLELVLDLSTATFIRCLKRFTARRGLPKRIVSDNAKTFKAAAKAIETMLNHEDLKDHLMNLRIDWNFNLEKAPWWGGLFERLIRSTKRCLRKMIGKARLSYDEMHTAILEVEAILNSRPLSYTTSDDTEEPLTPAHLLIGRRLLSLPDNLSYYEDGDDNFEITTEPLQRRVKYLNSVINHFWRRWSREYLLELRDSHRCRATNKEAPIVKIGDVVVIHDEDKPRGFWRLARIQKLLAGKDSEIRGAVLRVSNRNGQLSTLQRPVQRLYPLEINCEIKENATEARQTHFSLDELNDGAPTETSTNRPVRTAAVRATEKLKQWTAQILQDEAVDS